MDEVILWEKEALEDIYNHFMREEEITLSPKYYDILEEYIYKLFNTSTQDRSTQENIIKLCRYVNAYTTNVSDYRIVKTLSTLEINVPIMEEEKSTDDISKTYIYNEFNKYGGSPAKALKKSLNIASVLYQNLLILGNSKENLELRKYINNFLLEPEKYTRFKNQKYGEHNVSLTYIENFLFKLKLQGKTDTIKNFISALKN